MTILKNVEFNSVECLKCFQIYMISGLIIFGYTLEISLNAPPPLPSTCIILNTRNDVYI